VTQSGGECAFESATLYYVSELRSFDKLNVLITNYIIIVIK